MSAMLTGSGNRRRTHSPTSSIVYNNNNLPLSPPFNSPSRNFFNLSSNSSPNSSQSTTEQQPVNGKPFNDQEVLSSVVIDTSSLPEASLDQFMLNYSQDVHNQASALQFNLPLMPGDSISSGAMWNEYAGGNGHRVATSLNSMPGSASKAGRLHHRGPSSSSSIDSNESATPLPHIYQQQQQQQHQQRQKQQHQPGQRTMLSASRSNQKPTRLSQQINVTSSTSPLKNHHLPTPTQTPVQEGFLGTTSTASNLNPNNNDSQNLDSTVAASLAMNQALLDPQQLQDDELPGMSTGRHSFSSIGQEPTTPMTASGDHGEEGMRTNPNGEKTSSGIDTWLQDYLLFTDDSDIATSRSIVPKYERPLADIYGEDGYLPQQKAEMVKPVNTNMFLSPYNGSVTERLQAAQMARSNSSASSQSRGLSPFRADSPWAQGSRFNTAAQAREHQKAKVDADELAYQMSPHESNETTQTISPKDALLEYHPSADEQPLFPQTSTAFGSYGAVSASTAPQSQYVPSTSMDFGNMSASRAEQWLGPFNQVSIPTYTSASQQPYSYAPSLPEVSNGLPIFSSQLSASSAMSPPKSLNDSLKLGAATPEFPAHLTTMDSSASETAPPSSATSNQIMESPKPNTAADTGTYSCTYHGCTQRFSTPQKLQKHKRDAHRSSTNITPGVGSGMSTAALMARNSQSGPHKCERINPKTGQACNTVFSRPYDLTRHEDTTHNIRKQKIRCALCTEEKTFSRSDALTRHMRIVHPDVDFPGKHRRRGGASD